MLLPLVSITEENGRVGHTDPTSLMAKLCTSNVVLASREAL